MYLLLQEIILSNKVTYVNEKLNAWSVSSSVFNKTHDTVLRTNSQGQKNLISKIWGLTLRDPVCKSTLRVTSS